MPVMHIRSKPRRSLRGSVTQNKPSLRLDPLEDGSRFGVFARATLSAGAATLLVGLSLWLWHIGWPQRQMEHARIAAMGWTQKAHFAVTDIQVDGRQHTTKEQLFSALGVASGSPVLDFDALTAAQRIGKLPWVSAVTIERRLPDTIIVHVTEREPMARYQHGGHTIVIDESGKELPEASLDQFANLPLIVGAGAAMQAKDFLAAVKTFPAIADKMNAAVWVGLRRWDIYLQPRIVAKLPEGGLADALKRLSELITTQKVLERNILSIDLRLPNQITMEPANSPTTQEHAGVGARL